MRRMVTNNTIDNLDERITALEEGGGGTEYTAGTGINITEDVISADFTEVQGKLTAGSNISISDGVISATDTTYSAGTGIDITNNEISLDNAISVSTLEAISSITTDFLQTNDIELADSHIQFLNAANIRSLYVINDDKPFEITTYRGSRIEFDTNGLVSLTTKDNNNTVTYTFKADGIYIGSTKITN